jgi:hypothetical protein
MHIVKWVEECVSLAFLEFFCSSTSLNKTRCSPYQAITYKITQHKHTIPIATKLKQDKQVKKDWFNILDLL